VIIAIAWSECPRDELRRSAPPLRLAAPFRDARDRRGGPIGADTGLLGRSHSPLRLQEAQLYATPKGYRQAQRAARGVPSPFDKGAVSRLRTVVRLPKVEG
jgi:hypothetical protein